MRFRGRFKRSGLPLAARASWATQSPMKPLPRTVSAAITTSSTARFIGRRKQELMRSMDSSTTNGQALAGSKAFLATQPPARRAHPMELAASTTSSMDRSTGRQKREPMRFTERFWIIGEGWEPKRANADTGPATSSQTLIRVGFIPVSAIFKWVEFYGLPARAYLMFAFSLQDKLELSTRRSANAHLSWRTA